MFLCGPRRCRNPSRVAASFPADESILFKVTVTRPAWTEALGLLRSPETVPHASQNSVGTRATRRRLVKRCWHPPLFRRFLGRSLRQMIDPRPLVKPVLRFDDFNTLNHHIHCATPFADHRLATILSAVASSYSISLMMLSVPSCTPVFVLRYLTLLHALSRYRMFLYSSVTDGAYTSSFSLIIDHMNSLFRS